MPLCVNLILSITMSFCYVLLHVFPKGTFSLFHRNRLIIEFLIEDKKIIPIHTGTNALTPIGKKLKI